MLGRVDPMSYGNLSPLCTSLDIHLAVIAILAGETPAEIYADDVAAPTVALILPRNGHRVFLAGETADSALIQDLRAMLLQRFASPAEFLIYYGSPAWEAYLPLICEGLESTRANREHYTITSSLPDWRGHLAPEWTVRQVDAALLAETNLGHLAELITEIGSESPSVEDFLQHKFGYCVQQGSDLTGWCLSEYNHGTRCEVGIETLPDHQRRGVALVTASALIEHAFANGITTIGWHCWQRNTASSALAMKLGGTLTAEYPVWYCRVP